MLPPLPYPYNELEPFIDARTMEIHYAKHHQAYVDNLNKALADYPEFQAMPLETLLVSLDKIPVVIREAVRNNGGGHFAHSLFWKIMGKAGQGEPTGELAKAIVHDFNSFAEFKDAFTKACRSFFASGWVWLCVDKMGKIVITSTPGHDVPMGKALNRLWYLTYGSMPITLSTRTGVQSISTIGGTWSIGTKFLKILWRLKSVVDRYLIRFVILIASGP